MTLSCTEMQENLPENFVDKWFILWNELCSVLTTVLSPTSINVQKFATRLREALFWNVLFPHILYMGIAQIASDSPPSPYQTGTVPKWVKKCENHPGKWSEPALKQEIAHLEVKKDKPLHPPSLTGNFKISIFQKGASLSHSSCIWQEWCLWVGSGMSTRWVEGRLPLFFKLEFNIGLATVYPNSGKEFFLQKYNNRIGSSDYYSLRKML